MASTPLTLYPVNLASSVLPNAATLLAVAGSSTVASISTQVGTATGWGEIAFSGTTAAWAAAGSEPATPSGLGACFDGSLLAYSQLVSGNWNAALKLLSNAVGVTFNGTLKLRFWQYNSTLLSYSSIGSISLTTQSFSNGGTTFSFPATSESAFGFPAANEFLYVDLVMNITSSSGATSTSKIKINMSGVTTQGDSAFFITTAGFQYQRQLRTRFLLSVQKTLTQLSRLRLASQPAGHLIQNRFLFAISIATKKLLQNRTRAAFSLDTFFTNGSAQTDWGPTARLYDGTSEGESWAEVLGTNMLGINTSNQGTVSGTSAASVMILGSQSVGDCEIVVSFYTTSTGDSAGVVLRKQTGQNTYYRVVMQPTTIGIIATIAGHNTTVAAPAFSWTASTTYRMRVRVVGSNPALFYVRVWATSGTEPTTWTWVGLDTSAGIASPGGYGIFCKAATSTSVVAFDHFVALSTAPQSMMVQNRMRLAVGLVLTARFNFQDQHKRKWQNRLRLSGLRSLRLVGRFVLNGPRLKVLVGRYPLASPPQNVWLLSRQRLSSFASLVLSSRYRLASQSQKKKLTNRYVLVKGHQYMLISRLNLIEPAPFPTQSPGASSLSYHGVSGVIPVIPSGLYAVNGQVLDDQPLVCTAPDIVAGNTVLAGSSFELLFPYSTYTATALFNGARVSLTFALEGGRMVTAPVQVVSNIINSSAPSTFVYGQAAALYGDAYYTSMLPPSLTSMLSVVCTLTSDYSLSDMVITTQFF